MMDGEDVWIYYHVEKIDLSLVSKTTESVCSTLGMKLEKSCEAYVPEFPKFSWTNLYVASLEFKGLNRRQEPQDRVLRVLYDGPAIQWIEMERIR